MAASEQAERARHERQRSRLILVMGVAGSGKTTLARGLLHRLRAVYLDNNFLADAFFPESRDAPEYLAVRPRLYEALYRIVEENLAVGNTVILDVPHVRQMQSSAWRAALKGLIARTRSRLVILRCCADEETVRQRLRARGLERDRWKLENWQTYLEQEPPRVPIPFRHADIDMEQEPDDAVAEAWDYLVSEERNPP